MEADGKNRGKAPLILILGTRWRYVVKFSSHPLYTREMILVSTEEGARRAPGMVWTFRKGKYVLTQPRYETNPY
jgi:hypothetical protein